MRHVGHKGGTLREGVYGSENVAERADAIDELLDRSSETVAQETVAAALFWIFETKTDIDSETARLRFRHDGNAMLSVPDKTFHVELRLSPGERYGVSEIDRMAEETATDHELLLITTNPLTDDARARMESCPSTHFIRLYRALQFDEVTPRAD